MFNLKNYKTFTSEDVKIPNDGVNIVVIETNTYSGQFSQEICRNVFGYDYSEYIRSPYQSIEYIKTMIQKYFYFDTEYFMKRSKNCRHDNYGDIICDICPTPNIENKKYPGYPVFNSVSLFFNETLSEKDMKTIENIAKDYFLKNNIDFIGIGQVLLSK